MKKAKTIMGNPDHANRAPLDFYTTPPEAVHALLGAEDFPGLVWEPACGDGAISRVLQARKGNHAVISSDISDYGFGTVGVDFLRPETWPAVMRALPEVGHVVTNPPFSLAVPFALQALKVSRGKVALLLRLQFLEGGSRKAFFEESSLARVWVFSRRISCHRNGDTSQTGGMMAHAWFVWEKGHQGPPTLGWINPVSCK